MQFILGVIFFVAVVGDRSTRSSTTYFGRSARHRLPELPAPA
jgi:hypothetical protein